MDLLPPEALLADYPGPMRDIGEIGLYLGAVDPVRGEAQTMSAPATTASGSPQTATTVALFGYRFHTGSAEALLAAIAARRDGRPRMIVTANVDHIVQLSENALFREAYARAAARTLDGMPLVWLARKACTAAVVDGPNVQPSSSGAAIS